MDLCPQGHLPWDDACDECMEFLWFKQGKFEYPSNMSPGLVGAFDPSRRSSLFLTRLPLPELLRKTLVCDPNCRATIQEIQQDEWFQSGDGSDSEEEEEE